MIEDLQECCRSRGRFAAFTLVELLVVIGLIALLSGFTLAGISKAYMRARDIQCMSNIHQLVAASVIYLNDNHTYPPFPPDASYSVPTTDPQEITVVLLNIMGEILNQPKVDGSMLTNQLPKVFIPPQRDTYDFLLSSYDPYALWGVMADPYWYTGYNYAATVTDPTNQGVLKIDPAHISNFRGTRRAVIWADLCGYSNSDGYPQYTGWGSWHTHGDAGTLNGLVMNLNSIMGYHRGWSDGSVEWVPAKEAGIAPSQVQQTSSYEFGVLGSFEYYYWF